MHRRICINRGRGFQSTDGIKQSTLINAHFDSNLLVEQMIKILGKNARLGKNIVKCPFAMFTAENFSAKLNHRNHFTSLI